MENKERGTDIITVDLGIIQQKSTTLKTLKLKDAPLLRIRTSCGCTSARMKDNQLLITYHAPEFPKHLSLLGKTMMEVQKEVTVHYRGEDKEIYKLKATIVP